MTPLQRRTAPWPDYAGNTIHEGDTIAHPSGERGVVVFDDSESSASSYGQWRVQYEAGMPSLALQLQIGWKGMAVVASPGALQTDTPLARIENALRQAGWLNCDPEDWEAVKADVERLEWMIENEISVETFCDQSHWRTRDYWGEETGPVAATARQAIDRARGVK